MQKKIFILTLSFLLTFKAWSFDHSHGLLTKVLSTHTKNQGSQVLFNYKKLKGESTDLEKYLKQLSAVKKSEYKGFSDKEKLAFLINAYNAFTIKLIVDNYPVKSIKDLGSFFSSPWKKRFIPLLEEKWTLDQIEHDTIRKQFPEPRIHFAVNCASIGCPSLWKEAFRAKDLDQQLQKATLHFLKNSDKNKINPSLDTIFISKIFKWYDSDFEKSHGSVAKFVASMLNVKLSKDVDIEYTDYDWNLNEWK